MSICILCQKSYELSEQIMEQRVVGDTQFCKICFTEFMIEDVDNIIF